MRRSVVWVLAVAVVAAACDDGVMTDPDPGLTPEGPSLGYYSVGHYGGAVPNPCPDPGYGQFDFWVGGWDVFNPAGAQVATSVISRELEGCVVMEDYITGNGYHGRSLNMYDAATGTWNQYYMDNVISNYRLTGGLVGESMVLEGVQPAFRLSQSPPTVGIRDDSVVWTLQPDGTVRQTFYTAWNDEPRTKGFDGTYVPNPDPDRATPFAFSFCSVLPGFTAADFLLGSWQVEATPGPALGTAEIVSDLNQCLIVENFDNGRGFQTRSFLFFDYPTGIWHRSVADTRGRYVELSGTIEEPGRLVLTGVEVTPSGQEIGVRNTLESVPEGVRQSWEVSRDGGDTWMPDLTLLYSG